MAFSGPLRVVVPGFIGARSVKWLQHLKIRTEPSNNFYMTSDYKVLPPSVDKDQKSEWMAKVRRELKVTSEGQKY